MVTYSKLLIVRRMEKLIWKSHSIIQEMKNFFFQSEIFPQEIDYLLEGFEDNKLLKCDAERMIEIAYKSGYVDAWREALFFTDN